MYRDDWLGQIQTFLGSRIDDAPDDVCKEFAHNLLERVYDSLPDELDAEE